MSFGIDTFRSHLDSINYKINYKDFLIWNGATLEEGNLVGGTPLFAGRNFLGGDFIWGHAEVTNASSEPLTVDPNGQAHYPLPAGDPSPEHPENLKLFVERVTPIQAPHPARQQVVGNKGRLFGKIDADAICRRIKASILSGEFQFQETVSVWLGVDPAVHFSADYWAGWADTVNHFTHPITSQGVLIAQVQIFRACVLCSYTASADGKLRPDPHVTAAVTRANRGLNTIAYGRWADFKLWDNAPADLLTDGSPLLDWNRFDPPTAPVLWRFAHGFLKPNGVSADVAFDLDAVNPAAHPVDFMLEPQKWQPNVPSIQNLGFSNADEITVAQTKCLQNTELEDMDDSNFHANSGHFHVPGGRVTVIGRYIKHGGVGSLSTPEAQRLSAGSFTLFTIWQSYRRLAGVLRQPREIAYFNPDPDGNPATHDDAGTQDGMEAFQYCGAVLKQPPQTPVFFALDFDPYDPPGASNESWITTYFEKIKAARDDFSARTGRHYLIGVYGVGKIMQALYAQGIVSHFWQAGSSGRNGSKPPNWPWFHANRWQYQADKSICGIGGTSADNKPFGIDPDADWGDGGTWSLADPLTQAMINVEVLEQLNILDDPFVLLADLEPEPFNEEKA